MAVDRATPKSKKALNRKWKEKHDESKQYKARLVVNGFQQKEGIDYTKIFSLIVKLTTIKTMLGQMAKKDLHLEELDIKTTFLHYDFKEEIYKSREGENGIRSLIGS